MGEIVDTLDRIATRGSQGVVLKAPDDPRVIAAVDRLVGAGIPVVTFVTDLPTSPRVAYVGIDNRAAGATAAYLVDQWLGDTPGSVLVTRGDGSFRGEDEREMGFRGTQRALRPGRVQIDLVNADGQDDDLHRLVRAALAAHPDIVAVYSMYAFGGNRATVEAFAAEGRTYRVFVAHDLHEHNLALLHDGHLSAVLHHDLRQDMRHACQVIMQAHGALSGLPRSWHSAIQVVTPYNLPPTLGRRLTNDLGAQPGGAVHLSCGVHEPATVCTRGPRQRSRPLPICGRLPSRSCAAATEVVTCAPVTRRSAPGACCVRGSPMSELASESSTQRFAKRRPSASEGVR